MRIGMLGCGNIGTFLLENLNGNDSKEKIVAIYSRNKEKTAMIANNYGAYAFDTIQSFLQEDFDLIVEVATIELVKDTVLTVLNRRISLLVSSIGAFSNKNFLKQVIKTSNEKNVNIYIPSGAVGGLDILQSANILNGLTHVQLTTRKPANSLQGAQHVTEEKVIFEGKAKDAIQLYPRNMNVAIAISLAGIGPEKTLVRLIADPSVEKNIHTIFAKGDFGEFSIEVSNEAMPDNPKTSYLAALSILSSIKNQSRRLKII